MSSQFRLTHRQQQVLWATVRHYIATAEPVGSEALVKEYNLSVSSATIRNVMGMLEKSGLLYQPYTSAGRIPSDFGYRLYVDKLMTPTTELSTQLEGILSDRLHQGDHSLEAMLRGASQILATVSGYIALITMPQTYVTHLRHVQLVPVDANRVMLIFVTDSYETQSALMDLPMLGNGESLLAAELLEQELQILSNFLNSQLRGKAIAELASMDWRELDREFQRYGDFLKLVLAEVSRRSQTPTSTQIMISGLSEVMRQPEFSEVQQIQMIVHLLEDEQDQLLPLIFEPKLEPSDRRVTVRIGAENPLEPIQSCALVSSTYHKGTVPVGSVGVLGPTRMMYENAIALVEATADCLSEALS